MKKVTVSVIIPVKDVEKYLEAALYSMVNQTLENIEIIIVNNGSVDNSEEIIKKYKMLYPDKIISIKANEYFSPGYARNIGLKYASGEYVYFMDADDITRLSLLENLYIIAKREDINITTLWGKGRGKWTNINNNDERLYLPEGTFGDYKIINTHKDPGYIYDDSMSVWSKLYKRDIIPDNPFIINKNMEDIPFCCNLDLSQQYIALYSEAEAYGYRMRKNSITDNLKKATPDIVDLIESCEYGLYFAKQLKLNDDQIIKAIDIYKKYIIIWLERINEWKIADGIKLQLMKQFCQIANTIFGPINKPEFYERRIYSSSLCRIYDDLIDSAGVTEEPHNQLLKLRKDITRFSWQDKKHDN